MVFSLEYISILHINNVFRLGRGNFSEIVSVPSTKDNLEYIRFLCFDSPDPTHQIQNYTHRYHVLLDSLGDIFTVCILLIFIL